MWRFFQELGVIDAAGRPTEHFGQPSWVYLQYQRRKGDARNDDAILAEARQAMAAVRERGVELAEGHGQHLWDLEPELDRRVRYLYADSKQCIWAELPAGFAAGLASAHALPSALAVKTTSSDRTDYILHPPTGERLDDGGATAVAKLRDRRAGEWDAQIVISDGLNALALTDEGHLAPYLERVRGELAAAGWKLAPEPIVVRGGRVRAGYRIGEILYGQRRDASAAARPAILHVIGERPGSGHHAYSVYITAAPVATWAEAGRTDHNITRVVSGIADTALLPEKAAAETVKILAELRSRAA
jgi:ethanolamine ammonia-lyase large subunit